MSANAGDQEDLNLQGGTAAAGGEARTGATRAPASLVVRTVTGAAYAIAILVCFYLGPLATAVIVSVMAALACVEVYRMMRMAGRMPNEGIGLVAATAFPLVALLKNPLYLLIALMGLMIACAVWHVWTPRSAIADVAVTVFAPVYTSLMYSSIVYIRCVDAGADGALLALGVMGSVWLNDSAAYFVGSRFGSHRLAPQISPNKSVEGLWGGLAGGLVPWLILAILHTCGVTFAIALPTGLAVGVASVMGDLFESRIKRGVGVKDSGNILPGHGGMLDRCDSMLFAVAVAGLGLLIGGVL